MRLRFWADRPLPLVPTTGFPIDPAIQAAARLTAIQEEVVAAMNQAREEAIVVFSPKQPRRGPRIIADRPAYIHSMSIDAMLAGMKGDFPQARRLHERLSRLCAGAKKPRLPKAAAVVK